MSAVLALARLLAYLQIPAGQLARATSKELSLFWILGARFDWRVLVVLILPALLSGLLLSAISARTSHWKGLSAALAGLAALAVTGLAVANACYLQTYHTPFDIFVFNVRNEEPRQVLSIILNTYPVGRGLLASAAAAVAAAWVWLAACRIRVPRAFLSVPATVVLVAVTAFVLASLGRGSLFTRYPLRRNNAQFSVVEPLNRAMPSGPVAMSWAAKDFLLNAAFRPASRAKGRWLLEVTGLNAPEAVTPDNAWLRDHPPHVVVCQMEMFGQNVLTQDRLPQNDLLGALRPWMKKGWLFNRFASADLHTVQAFSRLFFDSPLSNLSTSSVRRESLAGTPWDIYRKAGYDLVFVTSGSESWELVGSYLNAQGVTVIEKNDLIRRYGLKAETEWGVPDEYAFRYAAELLGKARRPTFLVILTTSNHPPYDEPPGYQAAPVSVTETFRRLCEFDTASPERVFKLFQYANNAAGQFLDALGASPAGQRTVVALTGDHKTHSINIPGHQYDFYTYAVPFLVVAPEAIKAHVAWRYDPSRIGSHKDVMPTLYALSLSAARYPAASGGRPMLAQQEDAARAFGWHRDTYIGQEGVCHPGKVPVCLPWQDGKSLLVDPAPKPAPERVRRLLRSMPALDRWQLDARLRGTVD